MWFGRLDRRTAEAPNVSRPDALGNSPHPGNPCPGSFCRAAASPPSSHLKTYTNFEGAAFAGRRATLAWCLQRYDPGIPFATFARRGAAELRPSGWRVLISSLSPATIAGLNAGAVAGDSTTDLSQFSAAQLNAVSAQAFSELSQAQIDAFSETAVAGLSPAKVGQLKSGVMFDQDQLLAFSAAQIGALRPPTSAS